MKDERKIIGYKMKCPNHPEYLCGGKCDYVWDYKGKKGKFKRFVTCPECRGSMNREKNTLKIIYEKID
jgi:hypothetical protein